MCDGGSFNLWYTCLSVCRVQYRVIPTVFSALLFYKTTAVLAVTEFVDTKQASIDRQIEHEEQTRKVVEIERGLAG